MQNKNKITTLFPEVGGVLLSDGCRDEFRYSTAAALADLGLLVEKNKFIHA
jgi:hypothetical protein